MVHERPADLARFDGSRDSESMIFHPCFFAVEKKEGMSAKSVAPSNDENPPKSFLTKLHHALVALGLASRRDILAVFHGGLIQTSFRRECIAWDGEAYIRE
jgi:hypothetical protein